MCIRDRIEPLPIVGPWNGVRHADAIGIGYIEGAMLWAAERQGVHSHLPRARPFGAARIVADSADLETARGQVTHRVASDDQAVTGGVAYRVVEIVDHFRRGSRRSGRERPAVARQRGAHLKTPPPEDLSLIHISEPTRLLS